LVRTFLLLGSNQGQRAELLTRAVAEIHQRVGKVAGKSSVYESAAWGKTDQPSFLNQVVEVNTKLLPDQLLKVTQAIEKDLGRVRKEHWGPRVIDIDILFYGDHIINLPDLTIPHVAIPERRFTLVPMNELAPEWVHPALHTTIEQLLARCEDMLEVKKWG
jgi:2-amino-4-hydroxy-6-hydroxymethyldihydropteridine diphosphokinase